MGFIILCTILIPIVYGISRYIRSKRDITVCVFLCTLFTFACSTVASMFIGLVAYMHDEPTVVTYEVVRVDDQGWFEDYNDEYVVNVTTSVKDTSAKYSFCSSKTEIKEVDGDKAYLDVKFQDADDFGWFIELGGSSGDRDGPPCELGYVLTIPKDSK